MNYSRFRMDKLFPMVNWLIDWENQAECEQWAPPTVKIPYPLLSPVIV